MDLALVTLMILILCKRGEYEFQREIKEHKENSKSN